MEFLVEGLLALTWQQVVMYCVGILLIWLAIKKEYEPSAAAHGLWRDPGESAHVRRAESDASGGHCQQRYH